MTDSFVRSPFEFLLVDEGASEILVSDRLLQDVSFPFGASLAQTLLTGIPPERFTRELFLIRQTEGLYLLSRRAGTHFLVFDLVSHALFRRFDSPSERLLVLQRSARLAVKLWRNQKLSAAEHVVPPLNRATVFPFPRNSHSGYRVVFERDAAVKRTSDQIGQVVLGFTSGIADDLGASTRIDYRIANAALAGLSKAKASLPSDGLSNIAGQSQVLVTTSTKSDGQHSRGLAALGFEQWLHQLTSAQAEFVQRPIAGPERIEGPAGTGKTLCLVLKTLNTLNRQQERGAEFHALFVTHSEATRRSISTALEALDTSGFSSRGRADSAVSLAVTTLQSWCATLLSAQISESELLDYDALEAKNTQLLHLVSIIEAERFQFEKLKLLLSPKFGGFFQSEDVWNVASMLRHEIGLAIKGRAHEDLVNYKRLAPIRYGLPAQSEEDRAFVFSLFAKYRDELSRTGQFDTDDVVLSALGQLDTPIWRRRRAREGFDGIIVDESHLFNLNELSIFHHLTRASGIPPIVFSIDRAQAIGDTNATAISIAEAITDSELSERRQELANLGTVFRSSPQIVALAQSVTASGATLFTNFENPLAATASAFTKEEEELTELPEYRGVFAGQFDRAAFEVAEELVDKMHSTRSSVCIVAMNPVIFASVRRFAQERNKPLLAITRRGDAEAVSRAQHDNLFVASLPEYVGGLEFDAVVLVGMDTENFPPPRSATSEARHFLDYAAHNLLYVAVTRARFRVVALGDATVRPSRLLAAAIEANILSVTNHAE